MSSVEVRYDVVFGKCYTSDCSYTEVELNDKEEDLYSHALLMRMPLNNISELQAALDRAYEEVEDMEIKISIETGDEYTLECVGQTEVDPDEINKLVAKRDKHTLEFFKLTGLTDEELNTWNASALDELPNVCDFVENFEPESPFDQGWTLNLEFVDPHEDEYLYEEEATETLSKLFADSNGDYSLANEYISRNKDDYEDGDLIELAKHIAEENNINDFVPEIKEY